MPTEYRLYDPMPDYDGSFHLVLTDRDGKEIKTIFIPDVEQFNADLLKTLGANEQANLPFLRAIVRYVRAAYGVEMSVTAAASFYKRISELIAGANTFFTNPPDSVGDTVSPPQNSGSTSATPSFEEPSST